MPQLIQRPLPMGSVIDYCGERATVLSDDGGPTVEVMADGFIQRWFWKFEGTSCTVVSVPSEAATANYEITVKSMPMGQATKVTGFVGTTEVITLSNGVSGAWRVTGSSCLHGDFAEASAYLECMQRSFARAREYGATLSNS